MQLKILTDQLRDGKREKIEHILPPDFLGIQEPSLVFQSPIHLKGEAYATDEHLLLQLSAQTECEMPCSICNEMTLVPLKTEEIYHLIPFTDLKTPIFDFTELVREEIVLLIPLFVECRQGKCPDRKQVSKLMKKPSHEHFPFADLESISD